ncbi:MAG: hypothetical protein J6W86_03585 [Bacteroidales bacterium]|nr:hypothetical protein [Bacteroidales bacterium]
MKLRYLTIALLALMLMPAISRAQNSTEKQLATIRETYAGAMKMLEMRLDPEYPAHDMTVINTDEMWPGSGQHNGKLELFYGLDIPEESDYLQRFPAFARYTYNIGEQKYYYEILWHDPDDGNPDHCQPIFFYFKFTDYHGKTFECRYYFWDGKLLKTICKEADEEIPSPEMALNRAKMIESLVKMNEIWNNF